MTWPTGLSTRATTSPSTTSSNGAGLSSQGELADERQLDIELKSRGRAGEFQSHACRHLDEGLECHVRELGLCPGREPSGREARRRLLEVKCACEADHLGVEGNVPHCAFLGIGAGQFIIAQSAPSCLDKHGSFTVLPVTAARRRMGMARGSVGIHQIESDRGNGSD